MRFFTFFLESLKSHAGWTTEDGVRGVRGGWVSERRDFSESEKSRRRESALVGTLERRDFSNSEKSRRRESALVGTRER